MRKQFKDAVKQAIEYGITFGEIDCSSFSDTCKKAGTRSIPEVKFFECVLFLGSLSSFFFLSCVLVLTIQRFLTTKKL
jgi:hypothetical protein